MKALIVIGCVVLYIAAGYITAWFLADNDSEITVICVLFWPVMLVAVIIWLITSYIPRKIFSKIKKK